MMPILVAVACVLAALPAAGVEKRSPSEEKRISAQLARARERLGRAGARDADSRKLAERSRDYMARAETAIANHHPDSAAPFADAADALSRAVDHVCHSRDFSRTDFPSADRLADRLDTVRFRVRQSDQYRKLSGDPAAKPLVGIAQRYYERARSAYKHRKAREADEFTKTADEIVRALEHLAYAARPGRNAGRG